MPEWVSTAVWWQAYPMGFVGAPAEAKPGAAVVHRLGRLEAWLDHAAGLGASGLALGPIFASMTHGYDTVDHRRIDPRLGDDGDFDALVAAAHDRGLRVMLDGVFNHVGRGFPTFQAAEERGPGSEEARWFRRVPVDAAHPDGWSTFEGHHALVELDHTHPPVAAYIAEVMAHWLDRGADAWRLDAAYAVAPERWQDILPAVRAAHPDVYVVGEVIHGDYAGIVARSGMDAVTQYELWKAVWSSLNDTNLFELAWAMGRHGEMLERFVPLTFVGNHDVTRLASRLVDVRHIPHALAVLFTVGGTPSIYAGDEMGFLGVKEERVGGDDAIRPAFPDPPDGPPEAGRDTYLVHRALIALRRRHRWLHTARTATLHLTNTQLVYEAQGEGRLVVVLNLADEPCTVPAPHAGAVEAGHAVVSGGGDGATAEVAAHGWAVLAG